MNEELKAAYEVLLAHAEKTKNAELIKALQNLAIEQEWEEPEATATDIAKNVRL